MTSLAHKIRVGNRKLYLDELVLITTSFGLGLTFVPAQLFPANILVTYLKGSTLVGGLIYILTGLLGLYSSNFHYYKGWRIFCLLCVLLFSLVGLAAFSTGRWAVGSTYAVLTLMAFRKGQGSPNTSKLF